MGQFDYRHQWPAFPNPSEGHNGMMMVDYFAAHAMLGILAKGINDGKQWDNSDYSQVAKLSYQMAEEMLKVSEML